MRSGIDRGCRVDACVGVSAVLQHCAKMGDGGIELDQVERLTLFQLDDAVDLRGR